MVGEVIAKAGALNNLVNSLSLQGPNYHFSLPAQRLHLSPHVSTKSEDAQFQPATHVARAGLQLIINSRMSATP